MVIKLLLSYNPSLLDNEYTYLGVGGLIDFGEEFLLFLRLFIPSTTMQRFYY